MSTETTRAIVLRIYPYRESSAILHLFTESRGRVHAIARGFINKKTGEQAIDRGQIIEAVFSMRAGSELETLTKTAILETFPESSVDIEKMAVRDAALEIFHASVRECHTHPELFPFLLRFLTWLEKTPASDANPCALWLFFSRFSQEMGFEIGLTGCGRCGESADEYWLNMPVGILECSSCRTAFDQTATAKIPSVVVDYLRQAKPTPSYLKALLGNSVMGKVTDALCDYCRYHFELQGELKSLLFLKSL